MTPPQCGMCESSSKPLRWRKLFDQWLCQKCEDDFIERLLKMIDTMP